MHAIVTSKISKRGWMATITLLDGNTLIRKESVPYYVHGNEVKSYQEAVKKVALNAGKFIRNVSGAFDTKYHKMNEANVLTGCSFKLS